MHQACFRLAIMSYESMPTGQGRSIARRLKPDAVLQMISGTEIFNAAYFLMSSQEGSTGGGSRTAPCISPSAKWLQDQVSSVSGKDISNFFKWHVHTLPFAYKLFVQPTETHSYYEYFGLYGEYTQEINDIHDQVEDFWSNSGVEEDIRLLSAHGSDLADRDDKLIPTLEILFGSSYDEEYSIVQHAIDIQDLISRLPSGYDNPLLTFNAFATDQDGDDDYPSIIIGDGYFEFQQSVGLGSEGPEYALTHEHAHHLQFWLGVPEENDDMQGITRKQELMADAFSAYFLAHQAGGGLSADEISNIHTIAYSVGDCERSDSASHHGTPRQRRCATMWGTSVANSHEAAGLDLIDLESRFNSWYNVLNDERYYDRLQDLESFCSYSSLPLSSMSYHMHVAPIFQIVLLIFGSISVIRC